MCLCSLYIRTAIMATHRPGFNRTETDTAHEQPTSSKRCGSQRIIYASHQHGHRCRSVVLEPAILSTSSSIDMITFIPVVVSSLRAVEEVHRMLLLRRRCRYVCALGVRLGIRDSGILAKEANSHAVPAADLFPCIQWVFRACSRHGGHYEERGGC